MYCSIRFVTGHRNVAAAKYLEAMRLGNCTDAEKLSADLVLPNGYTCEEMQTEYRGVRNLFVQRLRDRREERSDVVLYYFEHWL